MFEKVEINSKNDLIRLGIKYINKHKKYPAAKSWTIKSAGCSRDRIYDEYNGWEDFIKDLKKNCSVTEIIYTENPNNKREILWTKSKIINKLQELYLQIEDIPTKKKEFENVEGNPCANTVLERFNTWNKALIAAGIPIKELSKSTYVGTLEEVIRSLISSYSYVLPKNRTEEDFIALLMFGIKKTKWNNKQAINFMKQFDFLNAKGRSYGRRLLTHNNLRQCTTCRNIFTIESFYKGKYACKECARLVDRSYYTAKRRAAKLDAEVSWADTNRIKEIYKTCPKGMHVDHEIPLQGEYICGFHIETNLKHISSMENLEKGNHHISEEYFKDINTFIEGPKIQFEFNSFWR